jgi:hypothetical protein
MENPCHHRLPPSQSSSFALSSYPQLGARLSDLGQQQQGTVSSLPKTERQPQQQPLSFLGRRSDLAAMDSAASAKQEKEECQTLRPFFDDEWPRARASSWPGIPGGNASFPSATRVSPAVVHVHVHTHRVLGVPRGQLPGAGRTVKLMRFC